jgi:hypothetical protein
VPDVRSDAFREAVEREDISALEDVLAEDIVFRSPAVFRPYEGRPAVVLLLSAVVVVFEDFRYTDQVETGDTAVLAFSARVGDRALDGVDLLRFDADGRVRELSVYIRPLSGLTALAEAMGQMLGSSSG